MDAILDDVKSALRRNLLARADSALQSDEGAVAAEQYRALAGLLRQEAAQAVDDAAIQRKLNAAAHFEAEAAHLQGAPVAGGARQATATQAAQPSKAWLAQERPEVTMEDLVGLEQVKDEVRTTALNPFLHPEMAKRFRVAPGGGILFFGPPGTGKTMLAQAIAGTLDAALFVVDGSDLLSKWLGESEKNLAELFAAARGHKRAIIFVDEFQWLAARSDDEGASETGRRLICQLAQELQGFEKHADTSLLFLAATNYPWQLDEFAIRLGRFDKHIYVPLPDRRARELLFRKTLAGRPTQELDYTGLASMTDKYSASDIVVMADCAARAALDRSLAQGVEKPVTQQALEAEIRKTRPSASAQLVRKCEDWATAHS